MQSEYLKKLLLDQPDVGQRYLMKVKLIKDVDPFTLKMEDLDYTKNGIPPVTYPDIFSYLVLTHSFYTLEQMKAYKSLDAHKYFSAGFVLKAGTKVVNNFYILVGKVKHSQRANAGPLDTWIIISKDGTVSNGHCICMAGNSEVCSHVGALLFAAEYANAKKNEQSCTDVLALWPMPSLSSVVPIVPISEMDFGAESSIQKQTPVTVDKPRNDTVCKLLDRIESLGRTAALMRIVQPFAEKLHAASNIQIPSVMNIFDECNTTKTYSELMSISKNIHLNITEEQASEIEKNTRSQHASDNWYLQRSGRITASKFKAVCKTNKESPSLSLIKMTCYPIKMLFRTKATEWGLEHESIAAKQYLKCMEEEEHHQDFIVKDVGLIINPKWPQLGVSPDRMVFCECCLGGVLEIKCPYLLYVNNIQSISEYTKLKSSCLLNKNGQISLKKDHTYYYQVQMQIFISELQYCDFVIWSPKIFFKERILPDFDFWDKNCEIAIKFHAEVIMPELLGKYFTRQEGLAKLSHWCTCNGVDDGTPMILCDNDDCETKWFHFTCVGLTDTPNTWLCNNCTK